MRINLIKNYGFGEIRGPWKHKRIGDGLRSVLAIRAINNFMKTGVSPETRQIMVNTLFAPCPLYSWLKEGNNARKKKA